MNIKLLVLLCVIIPVLLFAYPEQENFSSDLTEQTRADSAHGFDVTKYELWLEVDDVSHMITGTVNAEVTATDDLTEITYDLVGMTVDEVLFNAEPAEYEHDGEFLTIEFDEINSGEQFTTSVSYHGIPQSSPGYGGGVFWNSSYVFTVSDPDASRYWWPCYDHPWDKAVADIHITSRDDWLVAANGIRTGIEDNGNGTTTTHWIGENPMTTYLVCFHISNFVEFEQSCILPSGEELLIQHFCPPGQLNNAQSDFEDVPWMIEFFSGIYGEYPFEKFGQCVVPMSIFSGMEHQTMVTLANYLVNGQGTYETVFAHELTHQWYGDCVAFLDFPHVWLSEGFATYSEALWTEEKYGFEEMKEYIIGDIQGYYLNWAGGSNYTVYNPTFYNYFTPPVYEKAASILHMLRLSAGDENFFEILQQYFATYMHGNAVTSEFQEVVENVTGEDYDQFFEQWIFGSGIPSYEYTWFYNPNMAIPRIRTYIKTSSSTETEFSCKVPIHVNFESGNTDTIIVESSADGELTQVMLSDIIFESVEFDPDSWLLDRGVTEKSLSISGVYPFEGGAAIYWQPLWEDELDLAGYNVYRSADPESGFMLINSEPVITESYVDMGLEVGETYYYKVQAVQEADWFSMPSEVVSVEIESWPLDQGILVIDESADGTGSPGSPTDEMVDDFYTSVCGGGFTSYDYDEMGALTVDIVSNYGMIIWHDDDISQKNFGDNESILASYVYAGGKLLVSGWKTLQDMSEIYLEQFCGSSSYELIAAQEFISADSEDYNTLNIDGEKLPSIFNGHLPYAGIFPEDTEALFTYGGIDGSVFEGESCAVKTEYSGTCVILGFPLYFFEESEVQQFITSLKEEFGFMDEGSGQIAPGNTMLRVYPNPMLIGNRSTLTVSYDLGDFSEEGFIELYNIKGQKLYEQAIIESSGSFIINIQENIASGVYCLRMKSGRESLAQKLVFVK